ncbi:hypothetical protein CFBP7900_21530 [Xanthomonas hortorum pv. carotae]|uniref:Uncharacterized protein n=1 Tax=Xanthomonas hortorum pv. carotae TaxID=487904 RepID=A0A6V7DHV8_9XANT|nr:hypothetical protein CFBP7900_21530 [Xanthomonas hortorum pv. carotae]CAD0334765.1 hypothetical protein CFBP7900_21530 [Xanthomonas hortorum pv. carotae]
MSRPKPLSRRERGWGEDTVFRALPSARLLVTGFGEGRQRGRGSAPRLGQTSCLTRRRGTSLCRSPPIPSHAAASASRHHDLDQVRQFFKAWRGCARQESPLPVPPTQEHLKSGPRVPGQDLTRHGCRVRAPMDGFTACPAPAPAGRSHAKIKAPANQALIEQPAFFTQKPGLTSRWMRRPEISPHAPVERSPPPWPSFP